MKRPHSGPDGGPAFPIAYMHVVHDELGPNVTYQRWPGMSLREYLVGQALVGVIGTAYQIMPTVGLNSREIAEMACAIADATLLKIKESWPSRQ